MFTELFCMYKSDGALDPPQEAQIIFHVFEGGGGTGGDLLGLLSAPKRPGSIV